MFRVIRLTRLVPFAVLTLSLAAGAASAKEKVKEKKFDFAKTKAFMCEIDTRPDFPVSTVLAQDYTYSILTVGKKMEPLRKYTIIAYLKNAQQENGGFVADKSNKKPSILFTSIAVETLSYLNQTEAADTGKIKSYVLSLKNADGGFGFSQDAKSSTFAATYFAVKTLQTIGALDLVDKAKTIAYLKGFERKDGGFGYVKGSPNPDVKSTYQALSTIDALGTLDAATIKGSLKFLDKTPYAKGTSKKMPDLEEEYYAVKAFKLLKATDRIDKEFAKKFIKTLYIATNGGFGPLVGYGSTPDSTTTALRVLTEIGTLKEPIAPQVAHK